MKLMFNSLKSGLLLLMMLAFSAATYAQTTVSGTVTDESGEPMISATVVVKGTTTGTTTDFDGKYTINVPEGATTLVFTYIGYADTEVEIAGQSTINVTMQEGSILDEVVVVGYGTQKVKDATGAVATLNADDFNQGVIASPEQLIQGRTAGVQVTTGSGEPGGGVNVRIRGTSSVRAGNGPLYVVDGVPLDGGNTAAGGGDLGAGTTAARNPLNFLNPDDIENISILKDASATAIYGSRGANGVVLITTKKGKSGASALTYSANVSTSSITKKWDLLDGAAFLNAAEDLGANRAALDEGGSTDWQEQILRTAYSQNHNISYGGGNESSNYRLSFGYSDQQGIIEQSSMKRYTGRINASHKFLKDIVTVDAQMTFSNVVDEFAPISDNAGFEGDILIAALTANPTLPIYDANGDYNQPGNDKRNPAAWLEYHQDNASTLRILGNISTTVKFTDNLNYRMQIGMDRSMSERKAAVSGALNFNGIRTENGLGGRAQFEDRKINNRLINHTLNYNKQFGNIDFGAVVGYEYQEFTGQSFGIIADQFVTEDLDVMVNNIQSATRLNDPGAYSSAYVDELQSYFGRLNMSISDKYLLTATVRTDGSSKFGGDNQYGVFPSFALGWRLSEEEFMPEAVYNMKLRLGWGRTGNQEFGGGNAINRKRYDNNGNLVSTSFDNPNLKWESTDQINVGLDFGFMNGRVYGSVDYFNKVTSDLLIKTFAAQPAKQPFVWENLPGEVVNNGIELSLGAYIVEKDNFNWDANVNFTNIQNEVQNTGRRIQTGSITGQGLTGAFAQLIADGQPLYSYYLRTHEGFDAEGLNVYKDNEAITFVDKSPLPTTFVGLTNNFQFGDFDASIFFNGMFGHHIYNNTANALFTAGSLANGRNATTDVVGNGESAANSADASTRFLEKGNFIRLQNMSLGYNVDMKGNSYINGLRIYLTAQNLLTITDYTGQDPEVDVNKAINDIPSAGIDYSAYPRARTFTLGVNVKL